MKKITSKHVSKSHAFLVRVPIAVFSTKSRTVFCVEKTPSSRGQLPHNPIVREPNPNFFNSVAPERVKAMDPSNI